tara:strand:- start:636 stop:950 length:315 start_codon:yes stop_codon:yes gene_type:complete
MFFWIIQQTIISIVLIISVHYIYIFFKNNLTIPKTKDLVNKPTEQYKKIYSSLNKSKENTKEMKAELKSYLKTLSSSKNSTETKPHHKLQTAENVFSSGNYTSY